MRTDNHTMKVITLYLGLDVHKDSITIAIAEPLPKGEIRLFGTITNDLHALEKALIRIRKAHPGAHLEVAYEADPCGFGIARRPKQLNTPCLVAAPSLIGKKPGSPFKTDKRDARLLARLLRAGELTAVYVPEPTDARCNFISVHENPNPRRVHAPAHFEATEIPTANAARPALRGMRRSICAGFAMLEALGQGARTPTEERRTETALLRHLELPAPKRSKHGFKSRCRVEAIGKRCGSRA
jgi:hypothetical protein